jgi:hypothetical protein
VTARNDNTKGNGTGAFQASVLVLRMPAFAALSALDQEVQRLHLSNTVQAVLDLWRPEGRIVLEAPDGVAIVGLGDPVHALDAAHKAAGRASFGIGLHYGSVSVVEADGQPRVAGDGLDVAQAVANQAEPGLPLATRDFRSALRRTAAEEAAVLQRAGELVDAKRRTHRLYAADARDAAALRRRDLVVSSGIVLGLLAAGAVVRVARQRSAARRPAVVHLDVKPGGEVWVDGDLKGSAPALTRLWLAPGPHLIELRNPRYKPVRFEVQLNAGEEMELKHSFANPQRREPSLLDRFKFW